MLNILRKRAQSIVIQVVVLAIAIVFVFWGVGTNLGNKRNTMAKVNGEEISIPTYERAYKNTVDNYQTQFGGNIPQGFLEAIGIQKQVINRLIQTVIFRQSGQEMGINVSKAATQEKIQEMEVFKTNGQFDLGLYKQVLGQNNMNPTSFEASLQSDLLTQSVMDRVGGFAIVPDSEVKARFDFNNEEIRLAYVTLKASEFLDKVEVKDDELASWYKENQDNYLSEPQIDLKYLFFKFDDNLDQVDVPEEKIQAQYNLEKENYVVPEQRHARHILLSVSEKDAQEVRAEKKKKAEEILQMAKEGKDFAELAKEYSEGPSAPKGGDLGFFGKGAMVPTFDEAVFSMKPGEISDVVETPFGFHIIKLEEVKEGKVRPLEEVKDEIASRIKEQETKGYTFKEASQAYEDIIRSGSLKNYSEQGKEKVMESGYFTESAPPGPPISDPKILQTAFSLKKGELSSLVESKDGYAILFVEDIRKPDVPELQDVREQVVKDYKEAKSIELARQKATEILQDAREKKGLGQVASNEQLQETGFIKRNDTKGVEGLPVQVSRKAFDLSLKNPYPEEPFVQPDSFIVYELLERRTGGNVLDDQQRQQIEGQLLATDREVLLQAWLTCMQDRADIWINEQLLK